MAKDHQHKTPPFYPSEICNACGEKYGNRECGMATWSMGKCDICGCEAPTTEPRDFGHLNEKSGWRNDRKIMRGG